MFLRSCCAFRRGYGDDQNAFGIESQVGGFDQRQRPIRETGAREEQNGGCQLHDGERTRQTGAALDDTLLAGFEERQEILTPCAARWREREDDGTRQGEEHGVGGHSPVRGEIHKRERRDAGRRNQADDRARDPPRESACRSPGDDRQRQSFRGKKPENACPRCPYGQPHRNLALPGQHARQQQVRDIRADDAKRKHRDDGKEGEKCGSLHREEAVAARGHRVGDRPDDRILRWLWGGASQPPGYRGKLRLRLR